MKVTPIKTKRIEALSADVSKILSEALDHIAENSVLAVTSKILSLSEGRVVRPEECGRDDIIEQEADLFLPKGGNKYNVYLTIKNNMLIPNAGVDESNSGGYYIRWPKDPQASAEYCWRFLRAHFHVKNVGVIVTDSTDTPLKWGVSGVCIAHCGFDGINDKIGSLDLFGRELRMTKINVAGALAAAAVLCMGEADEQTPIALIEDIPFVRFRDAPPTERELAAANIDLCDDLFGQLLSSAPWQRGKK